MNICILKEKNTSELRAPLIPEDISFLKKRIPKINFFIETSSSRIIPNNKYYKIGCKKYNNQTIDLFLSIKEVSLNKIHKNQNYIMFFHTLKEQKSNIPLLKKILKRNCSLIDYGLFKYKGSRLIAKSNVTNISPYESSKYLSNKIKFILPKILETINDDSIEEYYISKKGYLNYRYINLLNYLIES